MPRRKAPLTRYKMIHTYRVTVDDISPYLLGTFPFGVFIRFDLNIHCPNQQIRMEEQLAFSDWINTNLGEDKDLKHLLPIGSTGRSLFEKVKDGILLWYE